MKSTPSADAAGSGFSSGGHDEREQTLNAILVEMDGFETNDQVIVCAATNRVDVLDPALTRPGRFDRQIYVPLPDIKGRMEILRVHSRKVKLGPNVDLMRLARATPGFSGADLAAIINESALGATLAGKEYIEQDDLEEARDKVRWGRADKSRVIDEKDKIATAYHEAGHAVVQYLDQGRRSDSQGDHHPPRQLRRRDDGAAGEGPQQLLARMVHRDDEDLPSAGALPRKCSTATSTPAPRATFARPRPRPADGSRMGHE